MTTANFQRGWNASAGMYILQRVIPHYREPLFEFLYESYGIKVITAARPPRRSFLELRAPAELQYAIPVDIDFPDPKDLHRANVPIRQILKQLRPHTILAEFGMRMSSTYALTIARRAGRLRRLAFWTHGWQMGRGFRSPVDMGAQAARLPLFALADAIGTYSEEGATWVKRHLPHKDVVAVGNAIDTRPIQRAKSAAIPIRRGSPQLLGIGRFTSDKRFDVLMDIHRIVRATLPRTTLTLIGDGPERAELQANAGDELGRSIFMPGPLHAEEELAPHFMGSDALIIAGAAGLAVNHAIAYALPVLAFTRQPNGPFHHPEIEYVRDGVTGWRVSPNEASAMAGKVIAAYRDGSLAAMRSRMLQRDLAPSIDSVGERIAALFALQGQAS